MKKSIFITATDTNVGKTVVTALLGRALQSQGLSVGVIKPVQCAGDDAVLLKSALKLEDDVSVINPFFAPEPLSPHLALQRAGVRFDFRSVLDAYRSLQAKYDIVLIEGAGGLMVPITESYFVADMICDLKADVLIVSRPGLGTINHTILTVEQARQRGLNVLGVIFNQSSSGDAGLAEQTNPAAVAQFGNVPVLGKIPFISDLSSPDALTGDPASFFNPVFIKNLKTLDSHLLGNDKESDGDTEALTDDGDAPSRNTFLKRLDKKYVWHPFTQMKDWLEDEPLVIDRADGNHLIDANGTRYLDGVSSLWVTLHGHNHPYINRRLHEQIETLDHSTLLGLANTPSIELARKLVEIAPHGLRKVFYSDSGSTSVEIAIKMAYQYWQNTGRPEKKMLAHLENSYHGDTLGSVSVGGIDLFHKVYRNLMFETIQVPFPDCYRAPEGKAYPDYAFEYVDRFEQMIQARHHEIAAFVVEPIVQGAAGMIMWPKGVLKRFRDICRKHEVIFIADEVATGFGRTGRMFACEHEDVVPDIMCLAKGITGGYLPLAATLTTKKIFDGFVFDYKDQKTFFHGHTYTGNPLACAAAIASLEVFENEDVMRNVQLRIKHLSRRLGVLYNLPFVGDIRQRGLMVGIELVKNRVTKEPFSWEDRVGVRVCREARKHGVILRPLGNVIVLMPPLSILEKEVDLLVDVVYRSVEKVCHPSEGWEPASFKIFEEFKKST